MTSTGRGGSACPAPEPRAPGRALGAGVAGAVVSGLLASACCLGPLLAVFLGVTSAGALLALEPYRPLFAAVMVGFLGFGFHRAYWAPRAAVRRGQTCCPPRALRRQRVVLWLATAVALALFFVPNLLALAVG